MPEAISANYWKGSKGDNHLRPLDSIKNHDTMLMVGDEDICLVVEKEKKMWWDNVDGWEMLEERLDCIFRMLSMNMIHLPFSEPFWYHSYLKTKLVESCDQCIVYDDFFVHSINSLQDHQVESRCLCFGDGDELMELFIYNNDKMMGKGTIEVVDHLTTLYYNSPSFHKWSEKNDEIGELREFTWISDSHGNNLQWIEIQRIGDEYPAEHINQCDLFLESKWNRDSFKENVDKNRLILNVTELLNEAVFDSMYIKMNNVSQILLILEEKNSKLSFMGHSGRMKYQLVMENYDDPIENIYHLRQEMSILQISKPTCIPSSPPLRERANEYCGNFQKKISSINLDGFFRQNDLNSNIFLFDANISRLRDTSLEWILDNVCNSFFNKCPLRLSILDVENYVATMICRPMKCSHEKDPLNIKFAEERCIKYICENCSSYNQHDIIHVINEQEKCIFGQMIVVQHVQLFVKSDEFSKLYHYYECTIFRYLDSGEKIVFLDDGFLISNPCGFYRHVQYFGKKLTKSITTTFNETFFKRKTRRSLPKKSLSDSDLVDVENDQNGRVQIKLDASNEPKESPFIAFKSCRDALVVMEILGPVASQNGLTKMRTNRVYIIAIFGFHCEDNIAHLDEQLDQCTSWYDDEFEYYTNSVVEPSNGFDLDMSKTCEPGIHFFISAWETVRYCAQHFGEYKFGNSGKIDDESMGRIQEVIDIHAFEMEISLSTTTSEEENEVKIIKFDYKLGDDCSRVRDRKNK